MAPQQEKAKWPVFKHILRNGVSVLPDNKNDIKRRGSF
jgi:hypothetical protein